MKTDFLHFTIAEYTVENEKIVNPFDVVLLSDLHGNEYGEGQKQLIKLIGFIRPALILCAGDMIQRSLAESRPIALDLLERLQSLAPTFCVNGNHEQALEEEQRYSHSERYEDALKKGSFCFLKNERIRQDAAGNITDIAGFEVPLSRYRKLRENSLRLSELTGKLGDSDPDHFQILIAHDPTFMPQYFAWGADLTVCGHYHGGIMRLKNDQVLIGPNGRPFPKYGYGCYEEDGRAAVVTSGLGDHRYHIRIANPRELVMIHVRNKSGNNS